MKILNSFLSILRIFVILLLVVILGTNIYINLMSKTQPDKHHSIFGLSTAVVISGSMTPAIDVNDLIIIQRQPDYIVGDIIAFKINDTFVTHRIVEIKEDGFITKGDSNNTVDEGLVQRENIVGKVIKTVPKMGVFISLLKTPAGIMMIVSFLLFYMFVTSNSYNNNDDDNKEDKEVKDENKEII